MASSSSSSTALAIGSHQTSHQVENMSQSTIAALEKSNDLALKQKVNKTGWEQSDFPILCETCLGPNPFLRMTKDDYGMQCKVCTRPFTQFRWKPGNDARYKKTEICQTCARLKNCCQTCLFDLKYGLPIQLRDKYLGEGEKIDMPNSAVNRDFYIQQQAQKIETGELPYDNMKNPMLEKLARRNPRYERNKARICSFFVKGQCNRGDECPFRHEMPSTGELAKQNLRDRFHGTNDPLAAKLARRAAEELSLTPPEDKSITTLYVGGVDPKAISEQDLRNVFYVHGELKTIKMIPNQSCAFVVYKGRDGAEQAAEKLYRNLNIKGCKLQIKWGQRAGGAKRDAGESSAPKAVCPPVQDPFQAPSGPLKYETMDPMSFNNAPLTVDEPKLKKQRRT